MPFTWCLCVCVSEHCTQKWIGFLLFDDRCWQTPSWERYAKEGAGSIRYSLERVRKWRRYRKEKRRERKETWKEEEERRLLTMQKRTAAVGCMHCMRKWDTKVVARWLVKRGWIVTRTRRKKRSKNRTKRRRLKKGKALCYNDVVPVLNVIGRVKFLHCFVIMDRPVWPTDRYTESSWLVALEGFPFFGRRGRPLTATPHHHHHHP